MGRYLNPGNSGFLESLNSEIYVDKTGLIGYTNDVMCTYDRFVCVTRPRRFGKTMAANMLVAYYGRGCDSHALFDGLEIAKDPSYGEHINRYNVIFLDMVDILADVGSFEEMKDKITDCIIRDIENEYPDIPYDGDDFLSTYLDTVYRKTGIRFVFIIDEWDCVFRERENEAKWQEKYTRFLKVLLKDEEYVALAYMTGILPIKKYGDESGLNMFNEYTMASNMWRIAEFSGFTGKEVRGLCKKYNLPYSKMKERYDGYDVNGITIYNPWSVVQSVLNGAIDDYWVQSEPYEALGKYIEMDEYGMRDKARRLMAGEEIKIDVWWFQNDMVNFDSANAVMVLLIHLGYLTYNREKKTVRIPNREIRDRFELTVGNTDAEGSAPSSDNQK